MEAKDVGWSTLGSCGGRRQYAVFERVDKKSVLRSRQDSPVEIVEALGGALLDLASGVDMWLPRGKRPVMDYQVHI